jgi:hypothetical protein
MSDEPSETAAGRVRWSSHLPDAPDGTLLPALDKACVVATTAYMCLTSSEGGVAWLTEKETIFPGTPVLLPGDLVARPEDGVLVVRDVRTGVTTAAWPEPAMSAPAVAPDGDLVYCRWTAEGGGELKKAGPDGTTRWSRPLSRRLSAAPLVQRNVVIVGDGPRLRACDLNGTPRWTADRDGVHVTGQPEAPAADDAEIEGPIVALDDALLAELRWYSGSGRYVFHPRSATVARWDPAIPVHGTPTPVDRPGGGLVALGPTEENSWVIVLIDLDGRVIWTHRSAAEPRALLAAAGGDVLVFCSPTLDRWENYHRWYDLSEECFIRRLDPSGAERWTWRAPAPLTYRPALDRFGRIYTAAPGNLWVLESQ